VIVRAKRLRILLRMEMRAFRVRTSQVTDLSYMQLWIGEHGGQYACNVFYCGRRSLALAKGQLDLVVFPRRSGVIIRKNLRALLSIERVRPAACISSMPVRSASAVSAAGLGCFQ